jgi:hypothetical protein
VRDSLQLIDQVASIEDVQSLVGLVTLEDVRPKNANNNLLELVIHGLEHQESQHAHVLLEQCRLEISEVHTPEEHVKENPQ